MDMNGQQRIPASRAIVWKALNDPAVLEACIPGCQELIKTSDTQMTAIALIKVGPVTAKFQGAVTLSDLDPPNGYRIAGEGQGGVAGFAKGSAIVRLEQDGEDTILHYDVSAQVGGKLSQLGGRLIDATAKQMSGLFFKRFAEEIEAQYGDPSEKDVAPAVMENPERNAGSTTSANTAGASAAASHRPAPRRPRPAPAAVDVTPGFFKHVRPVGIFMLFAVICACWFLFGGALPSLKPIGAHVSPDFTSGALLVIVAAIGYLFGRQQTTAPARTLLVDREAIDQLAEVLSERRG